MAVDVARNVPAKYTSELWHYPLAQFPLAMLLWKSPRPFLLCYRAAVPSSVQTSQEHDPWLKFSGSPPACSLFFFCYSPAILRLCEAHHQTALYFRAQRLLEIIFLIPVNNLQIILETFYFNNCLIHGYGK